MAQRILVVDDEAQIRAVLRAYLIAEGYDVSEAGTGADALRELSRPPGPSIELVLLDLGLPDLGGLDVLHTIRSTSEVSVILVTARAEEVDKLIGLSAGADDYIVKPFSPREVVARVRTVLRRAARGEAAPPNVDATLRFEGLSIDPRRHEVSGPDGPVALSALEFALLTALATEPGRVFSRAQLLEKVWGYDFYGDERVVDVHVRGVRSALGDDASRPRIVGTVRGVGYKFLPRPLP